MHGVPGGQGNGYRTGDSAMDNRRSDSGHSADNGLDRNTVRRLIRLAEKTGLKVGGDAATEEHLELIRNEVGQPGACAQSSESEQRLKPHQKRIQTWLNEDRLVLTSVASSRRKLPDNFPNGFASCRDGRTVSVSLSHAHGIDSFRRCALHKQHPERQRSVGWPQVIE